MCAAAIGSFYANASETNGDAQYGYCTPVNVHKVTASRKWTWSAAGKGADYASESCRARKRPDIECGLAVDDWLQIQRSSVIEPSAQDSLRLGICGATASNRHPFCLVTQRLSQDPKNVITALSYQTWKLHRALPAQMEPTSPGRASTRGAQFPPCELCRKPSAPRGSWCSRSPSCSRRESPSWSPACRPPAADSGRGATS